MNCNSKKFKYLRNNYCVLKKISITRYEFRKYIFIKVEKMTKIMKYVVSSNFYKQGKRLVATCNVNQVYNTIG